MSMQWKEKDEKNRQCSSKETLSNQTVVSKHHSPIEGNPGFWEKWLIVWWGQGEDKMTWERLSTRQKGRAQRKEEWGHGKGAQEPDEELPKLEEFEQSNNVVLDYNQSIK